MSLRRFGGFKNWEFAKTANFQTRNQEDSLYLIQNYKNLKSFIKRSLPRGIERRTLKDYLSTFNLSAKSLTKTDDRISGADDRQTSEFLQTWRIIAVE